MPKFSASSRVILEELHPELQRWLLDAIQHVDFKIVEGPRTREKQELFHAAGLSKTDPDKSLHLTRPCRAVHTLPFPWKGSLDSPAATRRLCYFAGLVMARAKALQIDIRWGGDWNQNDDPSDQTFNDLMHFEYRGP